MRYAVDERQQHMTRKLGVFRWPPAFSASMGWCATGDGSEPQVAALQAAEAESACRALLQLKRRQGHAP